MARSDLLDYLQRYRDTPRRRLARVERWRRRGWSRRRIVDAAEVLAAELHAAGIGDGDRVGLWAKDGPLFAAGLFGVLRAGGVVVPIDVAHGPELAAHLASSLDLSAWVADEELPAVELDVPPFELRWNGTVSSPRSLPPWPADDPRCVAQLVLTSGTTGQPQSVELRHENLRAVLDALEEEIDRYRRVIRLAPRLRLAVALPLSHLYGQYMGVLLPVLLDADVAMLETLPAAHLAEAVRRERAWALASVPHTLTALLDHLLDEGRALWGEDELQRRLAAAATLSWPRRWLLFDPLRRRLGRRLVAVVSGGASLGADAERLWRLLGYVVVQGYGLTEAAPLVTLNHPFHARRGSVGTPLPGVEVRLADDGEILVRGRNVGTPSGRGPRIDAEGWLHTGDLGEKLDDGSIGFRGRRSDRIVTPAGVNVDADEIASLLRAAPQVVDAVVVERPWGEPGVPCAVLVAYPGADIDAAVRRANRELPDAARLRTWFVWPHGDLPRTGTGKVRREPVLAWLAEQATDAQADAAPADRVDQVIGLLAAPDDAASAGATVGELLGSLERVELAARLEELYGVGAQESLFTGEATIRDLAAALSETAGGAPRAEAAPDDQTAVTPPRAASTSRDAPESGRPRRGAVGQRPPDAAPWRHWWPVRAARFKLREALMHPLARLLMRIEVDSAVPLAELPASFLLAANHASHLDPVVMFALPRRRRARLAPAARWNFFAEHPRGGLFYFWGVLGLNLFPLVQLGDWRLTLRIGGELADRGHAILIYPEGEISRDGELHSFKQGVAVMSRELHLPIVPCATAGLERILPPGTHRPRRPGWRRPTVAVCIGEPLPAVRPDEDLAARVEQLERRVRHLHERARAIWTSASR